MADSFEQVFGLNITGLQDLSRLNKATANFNKNMAAVSRTSATFDEIGKRVSHTLTGQIDKYRTLTQSFKNVEGTIQLTSQSVSVNTEALRKNKEAVQQATEAREKLLKINKQSKELKQNVHIDSLKQESVLTESIIQKQKDLEKIQKQRGKSVLASERKIVEEATKTQQELIKAQEQRIKDPSVKNIQQEKDLTQKLIQQHEQLKKLQDARSLKATTKTEKSLVEEITVLERRLAEIRKQSGKDTDIQHLLKLEKELTEQKIKAEKEYNRIRNQPVKESKKEQNVQAKQEEAAYNNLVQLSEKVTFVTEKRKELEKESVAITKEENQTTDRLVKLRERLNKLQATREKKTGTNEEKRLISELIQEEKRLQAVQKSKVPESNILKQKEITRELVTLQEKLNRIKKTDPRNQKAISYLTEQIEKTKQLSEESKKSSLVVARANEKERQLTQKRNAQKVKQLSLQEQLNRLNREASSVLSQTQKAPKTTGAEVNRQIQLQEKLNSLRKQYIELGKNTDLSTQQKSRIKGIQEELKRQEGLATSRRKSAQQLFESEKRASQLKKQRAQLDQQAIYRERQLFSLAKQIETKKATPDKEIRKQLAIREKLVEVEKEFKKILKDPAATQQQKELAQKYVELTKQAQQRTKVLQKAAEQEIAKNKKILEQKRQEAEVEKRIIAFKRRLPKKPITPATSDPRQLIANMQAQRTLIETITAKQRELNRLRTDPRLSRAQKFHISLIHEHLRAQKQATQEAYRANKAQLKGLQAVNKASDSLVLSWKNAARVFQFIILHRAFMSLAFSIRQGVSDAKEFSIRIAEIQTISSKAATSAGQWASTIRSLSEQFANPLLDTAEGIYQAISNQITKAASNTTFLVEAMRLSITTVSSFSDAVSASSAILNAFNMSQDRAAEVNAILFKTVELGRLRLSEFANTIGRVSALSDELGVSLIEQQAALATLTIQGVKSTRAETFLVNIFQKLIRPSEELKRIFQEWGVTSGEAAVKTFGFLGVMQKLDQITKRSGDRLQEIGEIFQRIRATTGAAALDVDTFTNSVNKMTTSLEDAQTAFETVMESAGKKADKELTKLKNFFTVDLGKGILDSLVKLSDAVGGVTVAVRGLIAALTTLSFSAGTFVIASKLTKAWKLVSSTIALAGTSVGIFGKAITTITTAAGGPFVIAAVAATTAVAGFITYTRAAKSALEAKRKELVANIKENYASSESLKALSQAIINNNAIVNNWIRNNRQMGAIFGQSISRMEKEVEAFQEVFEEAYKESTKETLKAFEKVIDKIEDRVSELDDLLTDAKNNIEKLNEDLDSAKFENAFRKLGLRGAEGFDIIDNRLDILKEKFANLIRESVRAQFGIFDPQRIEKDKQRIIEIHQQIKDIRKFGGIFTDEGFQAAKDPAQAIKQLRQELTLLNADPLTRIRAEMMKMQQEQVKLNQIKQNQAQIEEKISQQQKEMLENRLNTLMNQGGRNPYDQLANATTDTERKRAEERIKQIEETHTRLEQLQKEHNQKFGGDIAEAYRLENELAVKRIELINKRIEAEEKAAAKIEQLRAAEQQRLQEVKQNFEILKTAISNVEGFEFKVPEEANPQQAVATVNTQQETALAEIQKAQSLLGPEQIEMYMILEQKKTAILKEAEAQRRQIQLQEFQRTQIELENAAEQASQSVTTLSEERSGDILTFFERAAEVLSKEMNRLKESLSALEVGRTTGYMGGGGTVSPQNLQRIEELNRQIKEYQQVLNEISNVDYSDTNLSSFEQLNKIFEKVPAIKNLFDQMAQTQRASISSAEIGDVYQDLFRIIEQYDAVQLQQQKLTELQQQSQNVMQQIAENASTFSEKDEATQKRILQYVMDRTQELTTFYQQTIAFMNEVNRRITNRQEQGEQAPRNALGGFPSGRDHQLAWVNNREFIMNPQASATYKPILEAMNGLRVPSRSSNTTNVGDISVTVNGGETSQQTIREIATGLRREIRLGRVKFD